jgi:general secretion pathway protein E
MLTMNEALTDLAVRKASRDEIEREAMAAGMRTLWDDGMAKVAGGLTSIEELARVTI